MNKSIIQDYPISFAIGCFMLSQISAWMNHTAPTGIDLDVSLIEVFWLFSMLGFFGMTCFFVGLWLFFESMKYKKDE